jgi:WD40 repeat protein
MARLWNAAIGTPLGTPLKHQSIVYAVAFSPDGKTVLTGSQDGTARLWDAATAQPLGPSLTHQGLVLAVAFSPDGKTVLTGSYDHTARLWDVATTKPIGTPLMHQNRVSAVAFSPDGKTVLTGGFTGTAQLWDISELPDDLPRVAAWAEVITGLRLDQEGTVHVLDSATWLKSRERLQQLGGPPETGVRR